MTEYVIVYGPAASGKTLNRDAIQRLYRCDYCTDAEYLEFIPEDKGRVLILSHTQQVRDGRHKFRPIKPLFTVPIEAVRDALGARWKDPVATI